MDIELPSDEDTSNNEGFFDSRIDLYEAYWLYVDGVRYIGPVLKQSEATKQDTDRSPLARHYNHFYEKKEEYKEKCADIPRGLPTYKEQFGEPQGSVNKISRERLNDLGISWEEGDDPIWLPPEYELPPVWENNLENLDESKLRELVRTLRAENEEIREERDELQTKLAEIGKSLSNYLDLKQSDQPKETSSPRTCQKCGQTFDSKQAKYGHSGHCDGSGPIGSGDSRATSNTQALAQLADELPELNDQQSTESHGSVSAEKELENLNHLLQGSL